MGKIDLQQIIDDHNLDVNKLAAELFPDNEWPRPALLRVCKNKALLDSDQMSKLAAMLNKTVDELYIRGHYKAQYSQHKHTFFTMDYRAELDTRTWVTRLFKRNTLFHTSVLSSPSISLSEYIDKLDIEIQKFKKDGN